MLKAFIISSIPLGVPLLFGSTGEIITEKSGSLNLGVEGMMAIGAIGGYLMACYTNSFLIGLLFAFISGALGALLFAFLTITLHANQNVTGLALSMFGVGIYEFIGKTLTSEGTFPALNEREHLTRVIDDNGIPLLRDIPYVGKLLFSYNLFVYIAVFIALFAWFYLTRTKAGLKLRSIGENPAAADASGVNVNLAKYVNITLGGGICGLGGLYLALITNGGAWNDNWINGMGWISVALVIFANWSPLLAIIGGFFFGMLNTLQAWKGNLASEFPGLLGWLTAIPNEFYQMLPFAITAIVLVVAGARKSNNSAEPSAIGLNYFREDR